MNSKLVLLVVVVASLAFADAQRDKFEGRRGGSGERGGPGGRGPGGRGGPGGEGRFGPRPGGPGRRGPGARGEDRTPPEGDRYEWVREVEVGVTVNEGAFVPADKEIVIVRSNDRDLRDQNLTRATTFYDFNGTTPAVAIKLGFFGPCYITDTTLTYQGIVDELTARNDTTVSVATGVALNGAGDPISQEAKDALFETNPALRFACGFGPVVVVVPADAAPTPAPDAPATRDLVFFTLDSKVTLTVPERPERPEGERGGFGGRRGGRRGGFRPFSGRGHRRGDHPTEQPTEQPTEATVQP